MNQAGEFVQDEINIRELLETVWKGKVIIAVVTAIAVFVSAIASIFFIPKQYESNAFVAVTPITVKFSNLDPTASIIDYLATMSIKTKADYVQQAKSTEVLEDTIKKLGLKDASGNYISASSLSSAITVTDITTSNIDITTSNIVQIKVNYSDPEKTQQIANTLSQSFADSVAINTKAQIQEVADSIAEQLTKGEKVLLEKTKALEDYRSKNQNIDVLKGEIDNLIKQIISYKANLVVIETQIASDTTTLQILENASQSANIIPSKDYNLSIDLNKDLGDVGQNLANVQLGDLSDSLLTININKIQTSLVSNQSQKQELEVRIPELESSLTAVQALLTDQEYKYNTVNNDTAVAQINYSAYYQRNREVTMYTESDIGKTVISVSSEATLGQKVSLNVKKNIIVSGMFGFCVSIFFVLFRNYWRKTKVSSPK